jgi:hypothetical protein
LLASSDSSSHGFARSSVDDNARVEFTRLHEGAQFQSRR